MFYLQNSDANFLKIIREYSNVLYIMYYLWYLIRSCSCCRTNMETIKIKSHPVYGITMLAKSSLPTLWYEKKEDGDDDEDDVQITFVSNEIWNHIK